MRVLSPFEHAQFQGVESPNKPQTKSCMCFIRTSLLVLFLLTIGCSQEHPPGAVHESDPLTEITIHQEFQSAREQMGQSLPRIGASTNCELVLTGDSIIQLSNAHSKEVAASFVRKAWFITFIAEFEQELNFVVGEQTKAIDSGETFQVILTNEQVSRAASQTVLNMSRDAAITWAIKKRFKRHDPRSVSSPLEHSKGALQAASLRPDVRLSYEFIRGLSDELVSDSEIVPLGGVTVADGIMKWAQLWCDIPADRAQFIEDQFVGAYTNEILNSPNDVDSLLSQRFRWCFEKMAESSETSQIGKGLLMLIQTNTALENLSNHSDPDSVNLGPILRSYNKAIKHFDQVTPGTALHSSILNCQAELLALEYECLL